MEGLHVTDLIYLASPYHHADPEVMEQRFRQVARMAGRLMLDGHVVYSPIVHCHPIASMINLPRDWAFWERFDRTMLARCDAVWVVKLPGWESSKGVSAEMRIAEELGLPITWIDPAAGDQGAVDG